MLLLLSNSSTNFSDGERVKCEMCEVKSGTVFFAWYFFLPPNPRSHFGSLTPLVCRLLDSKHSHAGTVAVMLAGRSRFMHMPIDSAYFTILRLHPKCMHAANLKLPYSVRCN